MAEEHIHQNNNATKRISKDVLKMNFMKRTTNKLEKQQKLQQQQQLKESIENGKMIVEPPPYYPAVEHIDDDPNWTLGGIMSEWRYSVLEEQKFGRFSYNGQNQEIEKLMIFHERRRLGLADPDEGKYIGDEDQQSDLLEEGELDEDEEDGDIGPPVEKKLRIGDVTSRRVHGYQGGLDETNSSYEQQKQETEKRKKGKGRNHHWAKPTNFGASNRRGGQNNMQKNRTVNIRPKNHRGKNRHSQH